MAVMGIADALRIGIIEEMRADESVFCLGEDIDIENGMGGAFTVTRGLTKEFGPERVINTPISEILIAGAAVGAAMTGMRPIADLQYGDFLFCMMDQLVNQAAKMCYMSGGTVKVPMVMRAPCGATNRGAQHAQSFEGFFTHVPGLKVICPSTPYDAKGMIRQAIQDDNPVIVFEHKLLYGGLRHEEGAIQTLGEVPEDGYVIPFGKAAVRQEGTDMTIVANLLMSYKAQEAAAMAEKDGIRCEVIDPRSLVPFDYETVEQSVKKTGRLMIIHEDVYTNGWGAQLSSHFAEKCIYDLDAPIVRIATPDTSIPFAPNLENHVIPSKERIYDEIIKLAKL
ncbi:MAG: alpha-ketoacid dehydrogenase subunit beta [Lachnospiraceae bacterium]|nr:alpha-ketoacid dehydrogenase subunit beta [Lachnospiraceae bacterium]